MSRLSLLDWKQSQATPLVECKPYTHTQASMHVPVADPGGGVHGVHGPPFSQKNHYGCTGQRSNKLVLVTRDH